jgi:hypothetical protein
MAFAETTRAQLRASLPAEVETSRIMAQRVLADGRLSTIQAIVSTGEAGQMWITLICVDCQMMFAHLMGVVSDPETEPDPLGLPLERHIQAWHRDH